MVRRAAWILAILVLWDWAPWVPPIPLHSLAQVRAQQIPPPSAWHPFRGGINCVQVADAQGNFNCSPLVTINPATGAFLFGPIATSTALVIAPVGVSLTSLANDLVIAKSALTSVAPTGPGIGAATLRVRPSPLIPGYCRLVVAGGNSFNQEFPVALLPPALLGSGGFGAAASYVVDFPGGPGGC